MYKKVILRDVVRVPPARFGENLKETILSILRESFAGIWERDLGLVLSVMEVHNIGTGKIIPGDGAAYYEVEYEALTYDPVDHEIVEGEVAEILEFGAFIRLGPVDGLVHVSQITNDFISFDSKQRTLTARESNRILKEGDKVRARIVTISKKKDGTKIGLTLRQPGLGKLEWIKEDLKKGEST
ncbi:MAG: DNA-directed RNA polymerase [Theionarchaea archaeon]|nr:MAG: DNA-directed RNA polymerase subunit E' [Theionarchaea archaeon DG-70]MBU7012034.1 DNA-directed RNA polymerase [Theionarchaea archaeon]